MFNFPAIQPHSLILFLLFVFMGGKIFPQSPENTPLLWQQDLIVRDMIPLTGHRLLVAGQENLFVVNDDYQIKEVAFPRLDRMFPSPDMSSLAAGIAWEKTKAAHLYTGDAEDQKDPVIFPMDPKGMVYLARDGALWLANPKGRIFRHHNGQTEQWEAGRFTKDGRIYGNHAYHFEFVESPGGQVVLYQQGGTRIFGADLNGFLIWDRKELRHVRVEGKYVVTPGCAEFLSENTLLLGSNMGLRVYDIHSGENLETWKPPENFFAEPVRPYLTRLLPGGTRLVFYCRAEGAGHKSGPFAHGGYTQIVEIKDGDWKKVPLKVDFKLWKFAGAPRPVLIGQNGSVWTPGRGTGLVHRFPDGTWQDYDVSAGVPLDDISSLVLDDNRLWCAGAQRGLAVLDIESLTSLPPAESPWMKKELSADPLWDKNGRSFLLSPENGGQITVISPDGEKNILSLSSTGFDSNQTHYMALDTDGDPWLFGNSSQRYAIAIHKGGVWRTYPRDIKRENRYPPNWEHAYQYMLGKDPAFQIGKPDDPYYPVFSDDGRIAFIDRRKKVRYFDGLMWLSPAWEEEKASKKRITGPLFFHQGNLTAIRDDVSYQLDEANWTDREDEKQPAPWVISEEDLRPFQPVALSTSGEVIKPSRANLFPGCPVEPADITWACKQGKWLWVGNAETLAGSPGGDWISVPVQGTPMAQAPGIEKVIYTPDNRILFKHHERGHVYSIYTPPALKATPGNYDLGTLHHLQDVLNLTVTFNRDPAGLRQQFRIDDGPWSKLGPVGPVNPGSLEPKEKHILTVVYHGTDDLAVSRPLHLHFATTYDLQKEIQHNLQMLGSSNFQKRTQATLLLEEIGEPALEDLIRHLDSTDPEIRSRAREIILKIRTNLESE